jgi:uncharacterized membrane protein YhaH (DUF805 family)
MYMAFFTVLLRFYTRRLTDTHFHLCVAHLLLIAIMLQVPKFVWCIALAISVISVLFFLQCAWVTMQKQKQKQSKNKVMPTLILLLLLCERSPLSMLVNTVQYNKPITGTAALLVKHCE